MFKTEATLSLVLTVLAVNLEDPKLQEVYKARSDTLLNFIDSKFSISTRTKQVSKTKVNKIKAFSFLLRLNFKKNSEVYELAEKFMLSRLVGCRRRFVGIYRWAAYIVRSISAHV